MHEVSRILGFFSPQVVASCKYNEMYSIAKIPFSTKHLHLNLETPKYKTHEVEMISVHTQWHKHNVFGQSRISLDTGTKHANLTLSSFRSILLAENLNYEYAFHIPTSYCFGALRLTAFNSINA